MQIVRKHLTYANVMVTVLLFMALGGTAWALAKNSVGTKQLKNKAVTSKKIKNGAVTGAKIANGAISPLQLGPGAQVASAHIDTGGGELAGTPTHVSAESPQASIVSICCSRQSRIRHDRPERQRVPDRFYRSSTAPAGRL